MPDDNVKLNNKIVSGIKSEVKKVVVPKSEFSKLIDSIRKNSSANKKSIVSLANSFKKADKLSPAGMAGVIKNSIMQAAKVGVMKSDDANIKVELKNLEASEKLLEQLNGTTPSDKKQAKQLKELIDQTKKGLKDSLKFHNKFIGSLKDNTAKRIAAVIKSIPGVGAVSNVSKGRIGDVLGDIPFLGPLFDFVKDVKADAVDDAPMETGNTATESSVVDGNAHLVEIDNTTKETLKVAKKVAGIDDAQLKAIENLEPSEEEEREKVILDNKTLAALKNLSSSNGSKSSSSSSSNSSDSGGAGSTILGLLSGLLGVGNMALLLSRFKKVQMFFSGFSRLIMKIPGVGLIAKALGKVLSFPVTFVMATINGIWAGVDKYLAGGSIGEIATAALDGFANFFMAGFLKPVQDMVSDAIAKVSKYIDPAISAVETYSKWGTLSGLSKQAADWVMSRDDDPVAAPTTAPTTAPAPEAKAQALANSPVPTASMTPKKNGSRPNSAIHEPEFMEKSKAMADRLGINHEDLLKIMNFESAGLNPQAINYQKNKQTGEMEPKASGLIQFMPDTAKDLGTSVEEIRKMSGTEQLPYVEKYLKTHGVKPGMGLSELYMSVLAGNAKAAGKKSLWEKGSQAYEDNKGLDIDGNLEVSPQEATAKVENAWKRDSPALFEQSPMETYDARDAAEMAYDTEASKAAPVAPPVSMSTANNSVTNNNNTTSTVMMTPVRHQDSSIWKFNPVLV